MTITDVKLVENDGQTTLEGKFYRRKWQVLFTGGYDPAFLHANTEPLLQRPGEEHPLDAGSYVTSATPTLEDDSIRIGTASRKAVAYWEIQYSPKPFIVFPQSPLSRPPTIEGAGSDLTEVAREDQEGDPIVNSAGDFYDPLPERPVTGAQYTITRNEAANPVNMAAVYSNTCNDAQWYINAEGCALMGLITYRKVTEQVEGNLFEYWQVSYPIKENPKGWRFKPIDNGWRKKDEDGDLFQVTDPVGNTTMIPVLLDGEGGVLEDGGTPVVYPPEGYTIIPETSWDSLGLPDPDSL